MDPKIIADIKDGYETDATFQKLLKNSASLVSPMAPSSSPFPR